MTKALKTTFHCWLERAERLIIIINSQDSKKRSQDFIVSSVSSWVPRKPCFYIRLSLNTTWISKRCSIISVKKCLARCAPRYLPIPNICHAYTASVCTAWNNGTWRVVAATPLDVQIVKPLAGYLKVAIWKIFKPVFIWMAWSMCWQSKSAEAAK